MLAKIQRFSCITIAMLDIDGFRIDKALTITVDAQAEWSRYIRRCARDLGKDNFFIPGEIVSGNTLAALYLGRGKEPGTEYDSVKDAITTSNETASSSFIRDAERSALDGVAFHYSAYRSLTRFLGYDMRSLTTMDFQLLITACKVWTASSLLSLTLQLIGWMAGPPYYGQTIWSMQIPANLIHGTCLASLTMMSSAGQVL